MALSKIQAESMNLADTYAFTGTVSGAGEANDMKLLNTVTISSNLTSITWGSSYITDTHKVYILYFKNIMLNQNDNVGVRVGADGVVSTSTYKKGGFADDMAANTYGGVYGSTDNKAIFGGHADNDAGGEPFSGHITIYNMREGKNKHMVMQRVRDAVSSHRFDNKGYILDTTSVFNTIQILVHGSGVMDGGELSLYGLRT